MSNNSSFPKPIKIEKLDVIDLTGDDALADGHEFISVQCRICLEPPKVPVATICGHIYCEDCLTTALRDYGRCPVCRQTGEYIRLFY